VVIREADVYLLKIRKRGRTYEYGEIHVTVPREWVGRRVVVVLIPKGGEARGKSRGSREKPVREAVESAEETVREILKRWEERDRLEKLKEEAWRQFIEKIREFHQFQ